MQLLCQRPKPNSQEEGEFPGRKLRQEGADNQPSPFGGDRCCSAGGPSTRRRLESAPAGAHRRRPVLMQDPSHSLEGGTMKKSLVGAFLVASAIVFFSPSVAKACAECVTEGEPDGCHHSLFFTCTQKFGGCQTGTGCSCCLRDPNQIPKKRVVAKAAICGKKVLTITQVHSADGDAQRAEVAHVGG